MRTHLMHTVYMPPAVEPETGSAANDVEYARIDRIAVAPPGTEVETSNRPPLSREDEYALGGYAGI